MFPINTWFDKKFRFILFIIGISSRHTVVLLHQDQGRVVIYRMYIHLQYVHQILLLNSFLTLRCNVDRKFHIDIIKVIKEIKKKVWIIYHLLWHFCGSGHFFWKYSSYQTAETQYRLIWICIRIFQFLRIFALCIINSRTIFSSHQLVIWTLCLGWTNGDHNNSLHFDLKTSYFIF